MGTNNYKEGGVIYTPEKLIAHESYNNPAYNNDIGLIKTKEKIEFNDLVQSVPISDNYVNADTVVTLTGWGRLSAGGEVPEMLHTIDLEAISYEECYFRHGGSSSVSKGHLCTYTQFGQGACNGNELKISFSNFRTSFLKYLGDSGGPLVYTNEDGKLELAAAVNWGENLC